MLRFDVVARLLKRSIRGTCRKRKDVIQYADSAAADPLSSTAAQQRQAAVTYVGNDHQTHVVLCKQIFDQVTSSHAAHSHELALQYMASGGAALYKMSTASTVEQNLAALEAAAKAYMKFVEADPKSRSKFFDSVVTQQTDGKLEDFVKHNCK